MISSINIDTTGIITDLCRVAMKYGSDKCVYAQSSNGYRHPYTGVYNSWFSSLRDKNINIAEIGIEHNDSINIWRDYFPNAKIYGYEYHKEHIDFALSQNLRDVQYNQIDVRSRDSIRQAFLSTKIKYDIIIDDSTHIFEDQINVIKESVNFLNPGGILVIEDIYKTHYSYDESRYESELQDVLEYFSVAIFINTDHDLKYSGDWNNDKLLLLIRNEKKVEDLKDNVIELENKDSENSKVFIITPSKRPLNLQFLHKNVPDECEWLIVLDKTIKNEYEIGNATIIKSQETGFYGNPNRNVGLEYIKNNLNPKDNDWIYILDDDNIIHPNWWPRIQNYLNDPENSIITWGQLWASGEPRTAPVSDPKVGNIDTSQYLIKWGLAKNLRFENLYEADGVYAEEAAKHGKVLMLNEYLGYYNYLRSYKFGQEIRTNICMIAMFKNESKGIRRMLESVWKHIDFYVFQDNGSTDGTPDIIREFFADKNIPGFIYEVEEGWVSFGWNRDHLLQTTLKTDHGCDWIMKMDCDEYLEADDDFDWSYFYNKNTQSFHVTAVSPGCIYYRAWIWNAELPWKFQHDPAHEIIYLDNEIGENFERLNLPRSLRMVGTPDGESYTVRTKYISDALKLEEKMIREETMLTDTYHFWYIAKSYQDCYRGDFYPLGEAHSEEFARRAIFYYKEYLKHINAQGIHEMSYFTMFAIGDVYSSLGDYDNAIYYYQNAEPYCPVRNEHIVCLARAYYETGQYEKMLEQTTRLMQPERKLPFPEYYFLIDTNIYHDSGPIPQQMHELAISLVSTKKEPIEYSTPVAAPIAVPGAINNFRVNQNSNSRLWIVDNFYQDPHMIRQFALNQQFEENLDYYKGNRSNQQFIIPGTKEAFERIIGKKITKWTETHGMCGRFQYCTAQDDLVYHCDSQTLAGMVYLTPDAPYSCGTSLFAHKRTGLRNENDFGKVNVFAETGFYDRSKFELVDTAGNVFNRLVLFDAKCIHSANEYFGIRKENSRLFHLFFFD